MSTLTLRQEARRVYEDLGLCDDAISVLRGLILADPDLTGEVALFGATEFLHAAKRSTRVPGSDGSFARAVRYGGATAEDIDLITRHARPRAATWRLWNDRALRDASREEIEKQIEIHEAQITGNVRSRDFLAAIRQRLGAGDVVGQKLSDIEIQVLYDDAFAAPREEAA